MREQLPQIGDVQKLFCEVKQSCLQAHEHETGRRRRPQEKVAQAPPMQRPHSTSSRNSCLGTIPDGSAARERRGDLNQQL